MDFRFGEHEERLRSEIRAFLAEHAPVPCLGPANQAVESDEAFAGAQALNRALAQRGWIAPAWPKAYGGLGASIYEQMVFNEEFGYYAVPDTGTRGTGVDLIGPTLIVHGSEQQRTRYLRRITSGEDVWCQGYSEPGAGSDLASLATSARRDGDGYVINGQKIWTSGAHRANQMFLLVRTAPEAPKHRGISFLLIDDIQRQAGITIRPLLNMANHHHFNEVFFDNVRVPLANRVGEENRGWYVAMTLLEFERSGVAATAAIRATLERLAAWLREDPARRAKLRLSLAELFVANTVARVLGYRIGHIQHAGGTPNYEASVAKIFQSELGQRVYNFGVNLLGLQGQLLPGDPRAPLAGTLPELHIQSSPSSIYGGSNEIQRNIIAERGLGLPRG